MQPFAILNPRLRAAVHDSALESGLAIVPCLLVLMFDLVGLLTRYVRLNSGVSARGCRWCSIGGDTIDLEKNRRHFTR